MNIDNLNVDELAQDTEDGLKIAALILEKRRIIPRHVLTLELLANTRFATAGQLSRIITKSSEDEKRQLIEMLLETKFIGKINNIHIGYGRYRGIKTTVYFLTARGRKSLKVFCEKTARYAKVGFPDRVSHSRINHQLLTAEAYLDFHANFQILKCENEDILKSDFQIENSKRRKQNLKPLRNSGGYPDLKICFLHKNRVGVSSVEACVKLSQRQINRKSNIFEWYVFDDYTYSHIWRAKEQSATVADNILAPIEIEQHFRTKTKLQRLKSAQIKETLLNFLRSVGGGGTKSLIQKGTKLKETKLRTELEKMIAEGILFETETCLRAGTSRGRNVHFYYLPENASEPNFFSKQIIRSYSVENLISRKFIPMYIDKCGIIVFRSPDNSAQGALLLTDYNVSPLTGEDLYNWDEENISDYEFWVNYEQSAERPKLCRYFYASIDLQKIFAAKEMELSNFEIIDLSSVSQAQSYRYKAELSSDTITARQPSPY